MKLSEIAGLIDGVLHGKDIEIKGVSSLEAQKIGTIAYADKKRNLNILSDSEVSAIIINNELGLCDKPFIKVDNAKSAFSKVLKLFDPYTPYKKGVYTNVYIEESVKLGKNITVMPFSTIMDNAEIGDDSVIYSNVFIGKKVKIGGNCVIKSGVKIDDLTIIGDNVIIHHNSVIGGEGFGYIKKEDGNEKIPQIGRIVIDNDVEIGACVTIDRASIGETRICSGVKLDNLTQIAHNVRIGRNSIVVAQVGIAGSTTIGDNCIIAGQVGIADHINIGDNVIIMAQSGVDKKKIESDKILLGSPARDVLLQRRIYSSLEKLPELIKTVRKLKNDMEKDK